VNVRQRADAIGTFRFIEVWLMETAAAWTPVTPEMEAKVMFGRHIWDFAQHADWLGKRTFELRQPEHYTRTPVEAYLKVLSGVRDAATTPERLTLLYEVAVSGLISRYEAYLSATDRLLDGPSVLVIERILPELRRQIDDARRLCAELGIPGVEAGAWRRREADIASAVA
jgi:hypothetical protein